MSRTVSGAFTRTLRSPDVLVATPHAVRLATKRPSWTPRAEHRTAGALAPGSVRPDSRRRWEAKAGPLATTNRGLNNSPAICLAGADASANRLGTVRVIEGLRSLLRALPA